jgi:hypothetical protein
VGEENTLARTKNVLDNVPNSSRTVAKGARGGKDRIEGSQPICS